MPRTIENSASRPSYEVRGKPVIDDFDTEIKAWQDFLGVTRIEDGGVQLPFGSMVELAGSPLTPWPGAVRSNFLRSGGELPQRLLNACNQYLEPLATSDPWTRGSDLEATLVRPRSWRMSNTLRGVAKPKGIPKDGYSVHADPYTLLQIPGLMRTDALGEWGGRLPPVLTSIVEGLNREKHGRNFDIYWQVKPADFVQARGCMMRAIPELRKLLRGRAYGSTKYPSESTAPEISTRELYDPRDPHPEKQIAMVCVRFPGEIAQGMNLIVRGGVNGDLHSDTFDRMTAKAYLKKDEDGKWSANVSPKDMGLIFGPEGTSWHLNTESPSKYLKLARYVRTACCFPTQEIIFTDEVLGSLAIAMGTGLLQQINPEAQAMISWNYALAFLARPELVIKFIGDMSQRGAFIFPNMNYYEALDNLPQIADVLERPKIAALARTSGIPDHNLHSIADFDKLAQKRIGKIPRTLDNLPQLLGMKSSAYGQCQNLINFLKSQKFDQTLKKGSAFITDPMWVDPYQAITLASCFAPTPIR